MMVKMVEVPSVVEQSIDNSTNLNPANISVDGINEAQVPDVQLTSQIGLTLSILILWKLFVKKMKVQKRM